MSGKGGKAPWVPFDDTEKEPELHVPPAPKATTKVRIGPKLGLEGMTFFIMDIVQRGTMRDGTFAGEHLMTLSAADLETLTDIADTLDYFRIQRMHARMKSDQWKNR